MSHPRPERGAVTRRRPRARLPALRRPRRPKRRRDPIGQAVACTGLVESLDGRIKAFPQLLRATSPGTRAQLVRRSRALGPFNRTPGKPGLPAPAHGGRAHRVGRLGQRPQAIPEIRRQAARARASASRPPRGLRLTDSTPGVALRAATARASRCGSGTSLTPPFLPHERQLPRSTHWRITRVVRARTFRRNSQKSPKHHTRTHTTLLM